jgi:phytoene synthase
MATEYQQTWESISLPLAYEAEHQSFATTILPLNDRGVLDRAYAYCDSITSTHSRTFYMATGLLPVEKRRAMRALYAFCRVSDDIIDCSQSDMEEKLTAWRRRALSPVPPSTDLVTIAWADTRSRYQIPQRYAEQLIHGVARDLFQKRYHTFEDVVRYSYGVASTVGLMSMHRLAHGALVSSPDHRTDSERKRRTKSSTEPEICNSRIGRAKYYCSQTIHA